MVEIFGPVLDHAGELPEQFDVAKRLCEIADAPAPRVYEVPRLIFNAAGLVNPMARELRETRYQFDKPYLLDSTPFERAFGMTPTPLDDALRAIVAASRESAAPGN